MGMHPGMGRGQIISIIFNNIHHSDLCDPQTESSTRRRTVTEIYRSLPAKIKIHTEWSKCNRIIYRNASFRRSSNGWTASVHDGWSSWSDGTSHGSSSSYGTSRWIPSPYGSSSSYVNNSWWLYNSTITSGQTVPSFRIRFQTICIPSVRPSYLFMIMWSEKSICFRSCSDRS